MAVEPVVAFPLAPPRSEVQLPSSTFHRCPGASSLPEAAGRGAGGGGGGGDGAGVIVVVVAAAVVVDSLRVTDVAARVYGGPFVILRHPPEGQ